MLSFVLLKRFSYCVLALNIAFLPNAYAPPKNAGSLEEQHGVARKKATVVSGEKEERDAPKRESPVTDIQADDIEDEGSLGAGAAQRLGVPGSQGALHSPAEAPVSPLSVGQLGPVIDLTPRVPSNASAMAITISQSDGDEETALANQRRPSTELSGLGLGERPSRLVPSGRRRLEGKRSGVVVEDVSENVGLSLESAALDSNPPKMKFKLGFEFQEISGLCPWARNNYNIQKKSLFGLTDVHTAQHLWEVVLDTDDIEFVTRPFTYKERTQVERAVSTINFAFGVLRALLMFQEKATFEEWINEMIQQGIENADDSYLLHYFGPYLAVRDETIKRPSQNWNPQFTPQVTIQHPLNSAIPLYFGLFGFKSVYMMQFSASLPFRDLFLKAQEDGDAATYSGMVQSYLQQKMNGLVFLHALTLTGLVPLEETDADLLKDTYDKFSTSLQVDPKAKLTLMSRRPFSAMFRDIGTRGKYADYFNLAMLAHNETFRHISRNFYRINYGEQFFDRNSGMSVSLVHLSSLIKEEFLKQNHEVINKLLEKGIITTTMIRHFKKKFKVNGQSAHSLLHNYLQKAVETVDEPKTTFTIDIRNGNIQSVPSEHDALSPPYFLEPDNAMGGFKHKLSGDDRHYGEAIVEVRGIRDVQSWFLKKCGLDPELSGNFMRKPDLTLNEHALCLFDFLRGFGTDEDGMSIFYLGMPFALRKY